MRSGERFADALLDEIAVAVANYRRSHQDYLGPQVDALSVAEGKLRHLLHGTVTLDKPVTLAGDQPAAIVTDGNAVEVAGHEAHVAEALP